MNEERMTVVSAGQPADHHKVTLVCEGPDLSAMTTFLAIVGEAARTSGLGVSFRTYLEGGGFARLASMEEETPEPKQSKGQAPDLNDLSATNPQPAPTAPERATFRNVGPSLDALNLDQRIVTLLQGAGIDSVEALRNWLEGTSPIKGIGPGRLEEIAKAVHFFVSGVSLEELGCSKATIAKLHEHDIASSVQLRSYTRIRLAATGISERVIDRLEAKLAEYGEALLESYDSGMFM